MSYDPKDSFGNRFTKASLSVLEYNADVAETKKHESICIENNFRKTFDDLLKNCVNLGDKSYDQSFDRDFLLQ